jgi:GT2 family glycosyltransferase
LNLGIVIPSWNDGQALCETLDAINRLDGVNRVIVADASEDCSRMAPSFRFDAVFLRATFTRDIIVIRKRIIAVAKRTGFAFGRSIPKIRLLR